MSRFKAGDRVVVIKVDPHNGADVLHQKGTVESVTEKCARVMLDRGDTTNLYQWKYEYEFIFNSPLYKALE